MRRMFATLFVLCVVASCCKTQTTPHCTKNACDIPLAKTDTNELPLLPPELPPVPATEPAQSKCQDGMVFVSGEYCTEVKQECDVWKEPPCSVKQTSGCMFARCQKFKPSVCIGKRVRKEFCMDKYEYTKKGEELPLTDIDYFQAQNICKEDGKRLCKETEFEFACEGEDMLPYSTGLDRPDGACNMDIEHGLGKVGHINNLAKPSNSPELSSCVSPFGIFQLNGNADEWTTRDRSPYPGGKGVERDTHANALKGGWWGPIRARCRPATTAHGDHFHEVQVGFRCCL